MAHFVAIIEKSLEVLKYWIIQNTFFFKATIFGLSLGRNFSLKFS